MTFPLPMNVSRDTENINSSYSHISTLNTGDNYCSNDTFTGHSDESIHFDDNLLYDYIEPVSHGNAGSSLSVSCEAIQVRLLSRI